MTEQIDPKMLFAGIRVGDPDACRACIMRGIDIHAVDENGYSFLHRVALYGGDAMVAVGELLIARGANVNAVDSLGQTPLLLAAFNGHIEICRLLAENGADLDAKGSGPESRTPLAWAAARGRTEIFTYLAKKGASPSSLQPVDNELMTPFHFAVRSGRLEIIRFCAEEMGEDLGQRTIGGKTLVQLAGKNIVIGRSREVKELLRSLKTELSVRDALPENGSGHPIIMKNTRGMSPL